MKHRGKYFSFAFKVFLFFYLLFFFNTDKLLRERLEFCIEKVRKEKRFFKINIIINLLGGEIDGIIYHISSLSTHSQIRKLLFLKICI